MSLTAAALQHVLTGFVDTVSSGRRRRLSFADVAIQDGSRFDLRFDISQKEDAVFLYEAALAVRSPLQWTSGFLLRTHSHFVALFCTKNTPSKPVPETLAFYKSKNDDSGRCNSNAIPVELPVQVRYRLEDDTVMGKAVILWYPR